ncbi:MAG: lysylphosphatidylglycerol synthase transmembrane domain-containing protein [Nocardiopsaceae bacterium]|nr:lysylphosphatidylglycerol synthase transmembrane domain-containing protein [Nocardiopsaceae bacterium]
MARRPLDLLIASAGALAIFAVLLAVRLTTDSSDTADPAELRALLPSSLLAVIAGIANITMIVLVAVTTVERLLRREFRNVVRALAAAVLGYGLAGAVNAAVFAVSGPGGPPDILAAPQPHSAFTNPLHAYIAAAIAYVGALSLRDLPRIRTAMWAGIAATAASVLLAGITTALALLLTVLTGWTCAAAAGYAVGLPRPAQATDRLIRELRRFDLEPLGLTSAGTDAMGDQHFAVDTVDRRLDIAVMRADDTSGLWKRLAALVLLRDPAAPPVLLGLRRRLEHAALMDFAARAAGAAVPRIIAIGELGRGTAVLIREHLRVRTLDDTDPAAVTDRSLAEIWTELGRLHRHRIVHGNLNGDTVGWSPSGRAAFTGLSGGSVAAAPIKASLDVAAMLAVLALSVGEERAVRSAVRVLGVAPIAAALPLVQSAGMPFGLRRRLRSRREVLSGIRSRIIDIAPEAPARPAKLERMRPRTVASVIAATAVGLVLAYQLADIDFGTIADADPGWTAAAFAASTLCMVAAAMALIGFVPIRLPMATTVLVQYAASFIRIAAPAGLGSLALNTRYVTRMGASPGVAVSAVGLSQAVGLLTHLPLLLVCAYLTGSAYLADFSPSATFIGVTAALALLAALVLLLPGLRRAVVERVRPYVQGTVPQMLDLLQHPRRLAMGVGGTLLLTAGFVLCLHFSVLAFGGNADLVAVAVVFLAGNAIGSTAPTPGGLGAVEAAMLGGLTTVAGLPAAVGLPAVLLFRLFTFWFPALPGWGAFHLLQRWQAI